MMETPDIVDTEAVAEEVQQNDETQRDTPNNGNIQPYYQSRIGRKKQGNFAASSKKTKDAHVVR